MINFFIKDTIIMYGKLMPLLALLGGFSAVVYGKDDAPPAHDYDPAILVQGIVNALKVLRCSKNE